jgi:hypothetical protein
VRRRLDLLREFGPTLEAVEARDEESCISEACEGGGCDLFLAAGDCLSLGEVAQLWR